MENKVYYGEYTLRHWINLILKKNIVLPKYQRHFVWKKEKVKTLTKTLEKKRYVPPVTIGAIRENDNNKNYILDGQQRLTSILLAYLGVFPDTDKFKEQNSVIYANENDDENDDENDGRIEWTFEKIVTLSKEERANIKTDTEFYKPLNIDIDDSFWDTNFLGFAYIVPHTKDKGEQQKFYSSVFKNINTKGQTLSLQESRKSLYFLKDGFENFFETDAVKKLKVNKSGEVDFVKYLSLLSEYKYLLSLPSRSNRNNLNLINKIAVGYSNRSEDYYLEYIYSIVDEKSDEKKEEEGVIFANFSDIFPNNDYQSRFNNLKSTINDLIDDENFTSIIDLDLYMFGLVYKIVFENKKIDLSRKSQLITDLQNQIKSFKKDENHTKTPAGLTHLRNRIKSSIEIYNKYEEA